MLRKDYISQITKTARFIKSASKELVYHYENEISIYDNIFRPGSEKYFALIREAKKFKGTSIIKEADLEFLDTDIGEFGYFEGRRVPLDFPFAYEEKFAAKYKGKNVKLNKPMRGGKKFYVYVKSKSGNVKKIQFGDAGNLKVKINDPEARKNFSKRHKCDTKKDKTTPGYWACNIGRYWKSLGGKKNFNGYW
jgi:hypothetical protein